MQSITRAVRSSATYTVRAPRVAAVARPFSHATILRLREDKQQDPQAIEKAKQEQLKDGEKKSELQSQSEPAVHADKQTVKDHDDHIENLQEETAKQAEKDHPAGKA